MKAYMTLAIVCYSESDANEIKSMSSTFDVTRLRIEETTQGHHVEIDMDSEQIDELRHNIEECGIAFDYDVYEIAMMKRLRELTSSFDDLKLSDLESIEDVELMKSICSESNNLSFDELCNVKSEITPRLKAIVRDSYVFYDLNLVSRETKSNNSVELYPISSN